VFFFFLADLALLALAAAAFFIPALVYGNFFPLTLGIVRPFRPYIGLASYAITMTTDKYTATTNDGVRTRSGKASVCVRLDIEDYRRLRTLAEKNNPILPPATVSAVASRILSLAIKDFGAVGAGSDFSQDQASEEGEDCSSDPCSGEER
jgi:hypothetical protein